MILRIIGRTAGLLVAASIIIFLLLRALPGNPAEIALGLTATPETLAERSHQLGLDRPLPQQYFHWVGGLLRGDAGISLASGKPIGGELLARAEVSLILAVSTMVISLVAATVLGTLAARRGALGTTVTTVSQLGIAVPNFLAAIILVMIFAVHLDWLPPSGWVDPREDFGRFLLRLILPVLSLTLVQTAILTRYVRASLVKVMASDYYRTAIAMGATWRQAIWRHGLRNAAIPVVTIAGIQLTAVLIGAVVIERVFVIPGLGSLLLDSVATRDTVTIQTIILGLVVFALLVTMLVEILTTLIDPRVSTATGRKAAQ